MEYIDPKESITTPIAYPDKSARRLFLVGLSISVTYLFLMAAYSAFELPHMKAMTPDQFATFLSGAFAPLAFLWIVLGFRQQGEELQNSARALWLQGEELRNSVEQQRQLVEVSREQLESERAQQIEARKDAERSAQPQLVLVQNGGTYSSGLANLDYLLTGARSQCSAVQIFVDGALVNGIPVLAPGAEVRFRLTFPQEEPREHNVVVRYTDILGQQRLQRFRIPLNDPTGPSGHRVLGPPLRIGDPELATDF